MATKAAPWLASSAALDVESASAADERENINSRNAESRRSTGLVDRPFEHMQAAARTDPQVPFKLPPFRHLQLPHNGFQKWGLLVRRLSSRGSGLLGVGMDARAIIGWNLGGYGSHKACRRSGWPSLRTIDRAYVGRVERGSENVTITTLEAFARALSVPIATPRRTSARDAPPPARAGRRARSKVPR